MAFITDEHDYHSDSYSDASKSREAQTKEKRRGPLIIGVNGIAGAGKDTISNMVILSLENDHNLKAKTFAFADNLKKAAAIIFNVPLEDFYDRTRKEEIVSYWGMSPRQMAQLLGTEACRKGIRDDIWIKSLESSIGSADVDVAFITDVRFDNEAEFVRSGMTNGNGIVVNIYRDTQEKIKDSGHASEAGINAGLIDYRVENITGNPFAAAAKLQKIVLEGLN